MTLYDDLESVKIKIYDKGITLNNHQNPGKLYQMLVGLPHRKRAAAAKSTERRRSVAKLITSGDRGAAGLRVVEVLQAATQSMT